MSRTDTAFTPLHTLKGANILQFVRLMLKYWADQPPPRSVNPMKRGDVYMAGLDPVIGSEQGGFRPVVIIQNDRGNLHAPTVIAVPLTGSASKPQLPTHVLISAGEAGLWRDSIALCEQVRTLEKTRLARKLGTLNTQTLAAISRALQKSMDITCNCEEC